MIKGLAKLLVGAMVICLAGCGVGTTPEESKSQSGNKQITDKTIVLQLSDNVTMELNRIEAGKFSMGTPEGFGEEDELPVKEVTLTKDYYIGKYEVTQEQWQALMGSNPSTFKGKNLPVETVSWKDCNEFCKKLSEKTGYQVSLPTEAQWEYACRAGSRDRWFFGDTDVEYRKYASVEEDKQTYPVGKYEPNANGLYDMYGNVMEWCLDYYAPDYSLLKNQNPTGVEQGETRVSRGGGWGVGTDFCRSGCRNACAEDNATDGIGFRVVVNQ